MSCEFTILCGVIPHLLNQDFNWDQRMWWCDGISDLSQGPIKSDFSNVARHIDEAQDDSEESDDDQGVGSTYKF